jgi:hypothetical protein
MAGWLGNNRIRVQVHPGQAFVSLVLAMVLLQNLVYPLSLEKDYVDKKNNFSLRYPESWTVKGNPDSVNLIKADLLSADKKSGMQIRIYKNHYPSFSQFADWYREQFQREVSPCLLLTSHEHSIAGHPGYAFSFDGRKRNGYFLKSILLFDQDTVFVFQCGCRYFQKDLYEPLFDRIAASFTRLAKH